MNLSSRFFRQALKASCGCRRFANKPVAAKQTLDEKEDPTLIRNIGIFAHIDAGKTTTTERMLFYSGTIRNMGEVHEGNTVTDFMDQERERGITIAAASVTFPWGKHKINLVDTPGHIDFTMEVEQTLSVLDGAVVVLDASAGVEPQTVTVWRQAEKYKIPRIIYVNKMDKNRAGFFYSVHSIESKLQSIPIVLQLPIINKEKVFKGVVDLLTLEKLEWDGEGLGRNYTNKIIQESDGKLWEEAISARVKLGEALADVDDNLAEQIITQEKSMETIPATRLKDSIKKVTLQRRGVPVLCGSSYKNIGVQLLMDSIVQYLPSPLEKQSATFTNCFGDKLCARAFKVRHDPHRGPLVFFRIYSGQISKGQKIYNTRLESSERIEKLMVAYADDYEEVDEIGLGNIAAVAGLKETKAGDLVTLTASVFSAAKNKFQTIKSKTNNKESTETLSDSFSVPQPVFFCSVEAPSQAHQGALDKALAELEREDPSLRISVNNETGQIVMSGMGELHLEIIAERIRREYKIDVSLGPVHIAYKETLINPATDTHIVQHAIGNSKHYVKVTMSVTPTTSNNGDILRLDKSRESAANIASIFPKHLVAIKNGVEAAVSYGPKLGCSVVNVYATLHWFEFGKGTSETIITSAVSQCIKKLLAAGGTRLLEPVMRLEVVCSSEIMRNVIENLGQRRSEIQQVTHSRGMDEVVEAFVPLSELLGYATFLRTSTSGRASLSMQFSHLKVMDAVEEAKAIKAVTGLDPL